jgi:DNA topoisomerase-3
METAGRLVEEEELKAALKDRGLGTPATRAAIIETLLEREYIRREGKSLVATDSGRYLIGLVQEPSLKSPELTGNWEGKLREIEAGRLAPGSFMQEIVAYTRRIIDSSDLDNVDEGRLGDCPRCGKPVVEGKRDFGCSGWREGCEFVLLRRHQDRDLTIEEVRQLLQKRIAPNPSPGDSEGGVVLTLFQGTIIEVPIPAAITVRRRPEKSPRKKGPGRKAAKRGAPRAKRLGPAARRVARAGAKEVRKPGREPTPTSREGAIGTCPVCRGAVTEQEESFRCTSGHCKFSIGKWIAGKEISPALARSLLESRRTPPITGFQSAGGNEFAARLKIVNGQVRFDFSA